LLSQVPIALQQRKMQEGVTITDLIVGQMRTSEEFKAENVPLIDKAKLTSQPLRNIKILKIKRKLSILPLALQRVLRPQLKPKIHLELSI
jgi:BarA-like signal transduction histidine kinase